MKKTNDKTEAKILKRLDKKARREAKKLQRGFTYGPGGAYKVLINAHARRLARDFVESDEGDDLEDILKDAIIKGIAIGSKG